MPNLEELWTTTTGFEISKDELQAQYCFPVLSKLWIVSCPKLNVKPHFPPSLKYLFLIQSNEQLLSLGTFSHELPQLGKESSSCSSLQSVVPRLKKLEVSEMTGPSSDWEFLQYLTALKFLWIYGRNDLTQLPNSVRSLTCLQQLYIDKCPTLGVLPEWLGELPSLQELSLRGAPMLDSLPRSMEQLTSLVTLRIDGWDDLKQLPDVVQHLTTLQQLSLSNCGALSMLPEWIGELSSLRCLRIQYCSALQCLPKSINGLTTLQELNIVRCPGLAMRYKEDWHHLVSHIPYVSIRD